MPSASIPLSLSGTFPNNRAVSGIQLGAGRTQFVKGDPSIVINGVGLFSRVAGSAWTLVRIGTNEYDLTGDLAAY